MVRYEGEFLKKEKKRNWKKKNNYKQCLQIKSKNKKNKNIIDLNNQNSQNRKVGKTIWI